MKITGLTTRLVNLPLDKPITTAIHSIDSVGCVCVLLETDQGLIGESYIFTINAARLKAFDEMVRGLSHFVVGQNPHYVNRICDLIWQEINPTGHKGVTVSAMGAINVGCWDLIGKHSEKPLHHVFGACRDSIKTYASGGLWLSQSIDELQEEAQEFVAQGFRSMKIRVGNKDKNVDIERVRQVRAAIGDDIELLADANQALTPKHAIQLGLALQEYDVAWLEEPVAAHDLKGHAKVAAALPIDVASGETDYTHLGMHALLDAGACDVLMPDLQRVGGYSEMLKTAALASAYHVPISTHIFTEHSLCVAGAVPNCVSVEHMPWFAALFNEQMEVHNGEIAIPKRPGTGFTFNHDILARYTLV